MIIAIDVIISIILMFLGYVYVCYYFNNIEFNKVNFKVLKLTKNKILYCIFGIITVITLILLFNFLYDLGVLTQIKLLTLVLIILPIAPIDYRKNKIPNKLLIVAVIIRFIIYIMEFIISFELGLNTLKSGLLAVVIICGFFIVLLLVFKNSIGMGDIKLFGVMAIYQGIWGVINSVFFSLLVSFVLSIVLLITRKKQRKDTVAFAPSILLGTIVSIALAGM